MSKSDLIVVGCFSLYIIIGFLTFGMYHNAVMQTECPAKPKFGAENYSEDFSKWFDCDWNKSRVGLDASVAGLFWPVYWGGKIAIQVTQDKP